MSQSAGTATRPRDAPASQAVLCSPPGAKAEAGAKRAEQARKTHLFRDVTHQARHRREDRAAGREEWRSPESRTGAGLRRPRREVESLGADSRAGGAPGPGRGWAGSADSGSSSLSSTSARGRASSSTSTSTSWPQPRRGGTGRWSCSSAGLSSPSGAARRVVPKGRGRKLWPAWFPGMTPAAPANLTFHDAFSRLRFDRFR